ncbi:T9SS C-terminal target domain-containing protein [bacterium]|nr:MAG: T9SS C-terminal target domain-containing protein [bacterium]
MLKSMINPDSSGKKTNLVFGFMLIISLAASSGLMAYSGGTGTFGDPYKIETLGDLYLLSTTDGDWGYGKYFIQTADIDASETTGWYDGAGFSPIGNTNYGFFGSYNGQNHTINGLYINRPDTDFIGLFGRLQSGTLQNLGVTNVNITGHIYTGGLGGFCIEGSSITNCYSTGTVSGYNTVGGLVGLLNESSLSNSFSKASVSGTDIYYKYYIGGLVGFSFENSSISNCYSTGSVIGEVKVGGLVGTHSQSTVSRCYSTGSVTGDEDFGGLVGFDDGASVNSSFWNTVTSGQDSSAGGTGATTTQMTNATTTDNIFLNGGWDFKGESICGTDDIWNIGNGRNNGYPYLDWEYPSDPGTLPVELSAFTAQFIDNTPTLYWTTQSETDNMGWFVYRNEENDFTSSEKISEFIEGHGTTTLQQSYVYEDRIQNPEIGNTCYYWLESIDYGGVIYHYNKVAILTIPESPDPGNGAVPEPEQFGLFQNEPNPVIFSTKIAFNLTESAKIDLKIYNINGQLVKTLYPGVTSKRTIVWDGKNDNGKELKPGVYFYNLIVNGKTAETKKIILLK